MKKLYKDCQQDYEKNLDDFLFTGDNKYLQNILIRLGKCAVFFL